MNNAAELPDQWHEDMKHNPVELLNVRNLIEELLTKHKDIKFGGSAGVGLDGADIDMLIEGKRFNIRIQPR